MRIDRSRSEAETLIKARRQRFELFERVSTAKRSMNLRILLLVLDNNQTARRSNQQIDITEQITRVLTYGNLDARIDRISNPDP